MDRIETAEFSVIGDPRLPQVRLFGTSIVMKAMPATLDSPQLSIWTSDAEPGAEPMTTVTRLMKGQGKIVDQREIAHAGMRGAFARARDALLDEKNRKLDWYRLRALLVSADGASWYQATAMCSARDLTEVETIFLRVLDSIEVKVAGAAAVAAHRAMEDAIDTAVAGLKTALDAAADAHQARAEAADLEAALAPVDSVDGHFDRALAQAGLEDRRDLLRGIMLPALSVSEVEPATEEDVGRARIGGGPDLPSGMDWPRDTSGFHFNFLAQIDLAEVPDRPEPLPAEGLLSFFSGTDFVEWHVMLTPSGTPLVTHALPEDAERISGRTLSMVRWDGSANRFVLEKAKDGDLSGEIEADGRLRFRRSDAPIVALASEYEISHAPQRLRVDRALSAPDDDAVYDAVGLDDPFDFTEAMREAFRIGRSPRHQMFGLAGIRAFADVRAKAVEHARARHWPGLEDPQDWFLLLKIASGGRADFCFGDAGDLLVLANRNDTCRGDFSRVFAILESS